MTPDALFQITGPLALAGWAVLALSPLAPRTADRISGLAIPLIFAIAYAALILAFWSGASGGFDSLPNVMALFTNPEIALAGWLHYLAFDLLIGAWEVRTARREAIPHLLVLPCLALTFLFGPAGFLLFLALRAARRLALAAGGPPMTAALAVPAPRPLAAPFAAEPRFAAAGLLFALSLAVTVPAAAIDPRLFQDEAVWLKPIKFQIALTIFFLTLAFFARWLPAGMTGRRDWRAYASLVVLATVAEMLWIGGAAMAGSASHFNDSSAAMENLYRLMGVLAVFFTSATLVMGIAICATAPPAFPRRCTSRSASVSC